jgi:hypothetical protein
MIQGKIAVTDAEVADALPESLRPAAQPLIEEIDECHKRIGMADRKRHVINYEFWKIRCRAEASEDGVEARRMLFEAQQAHAKDSASPAAIDLYDKAFAKWRVVYDNYPMLKEDGELGDRLCDEIRKYRRAVRAFETSSPGGGRKWDKKTFILKDVIDARGPTPPID